MSLPLAAIAVFTMAWMGVQAGTTPGWLERPQALRMSQVSISRDRPVKPSAPRSGAKPAAWLTRSRDLYRASFHEHGDMPDGLRRGLVSNLYGWQPSGLQPRGHVSSGTPIAPRTMALPSIDLPDVQPFASAARAYVFVFVRTDCPMSNRYAPEVKRLHDEFSRRQVAFWLVYPGTQTTAAIGRHLRDYAYPVMPLRDPSMRLADLAGATVMPEAAIFDSTRTLVYRGRIDDRYVDIGRSRRTPTTRDVYDVLTALLAGRPVPYASQPGFGCFIDDLR
jgi:hypothetical protein